MKHTGSLVARLTWWFAISLLALYGIPALLVYFYASAQARQYAVLTLKTEAEAVANLDSVPPRGATLVVGAPKIKGATGGPTRVLALV